MSEYNPDNKIWNGNKPTTQTVQLADQMQMQRDIIKLKAENKSGKREIDIVVARLTKLNYLDQDPFVKPCELQDKISEIKMGYHAKIDMRMNKIESYLLDTVKAMESKCMVKILNRVKTLELHNELEIIRSNQRDARARIEHTQEFTTQLHAKMIQLDPSFADVKQMELADYQEKQETAYKRIKHKTPAQIQEESERSYQKNKDLKNLDGSIDSDFSGEPGSITAGDNHKKKKELSAFHGLQARNGGKKSSKNSSEELNNQNSKQNEMSKKLLINTNDAKSMHSNGNSPMKTPGHGGRLGGDSVRLSNDMIFSTTNLLTEQFDMHEQKLKILEMNFNEHFNKSENQFCMFENQIQKLNDNIEFFKRQSPRKEVLSSSPRKIGNQPGKLDTVDESDFSEYNTNQTGPGGNILPLNRDISQLKTDFKELRQSFQKVEQDLLSPTTQNRSSRQIKQTNQEEQFSGETGEVVKSLEQKIEGRLNIFQQNCEQNINKTIQDIVKEAEGLQRQNERYSLMYREFLIMMQNEVRDKKRLGMQMQQNKAGVSPNNTGGNKQDIWKCYTSGAIQKINDLQLRLDETKNIAKSSQNNYNKAGATNSTAALTLQNQFYTVSSPRAGTSLLSKHLNRAQSQATKNGNLRNSQGLSGNKDKNYQIFSQDALQPIQDHSNLQKSNFSYGGGGQANAYNNAMSLQIGDQSQLYSTIDGNSKRILSPQRHNNPSIRVHIQKLLL